MEIHSKNSVAPSCFYRALWSIPDTARVYIPCGSTASYTAVYEWSGHFSSFIEEPGSVLDIAADSTEGIDAVEARDAKIYSNGGQIVVEGAERNTVTLLDLNGRALATRQDSGSPLRFAVPVSGTYLVKVGRQAARKVVAVR